jgi:hypothetical protein
MRNKIKEVIGWFVVACGAGLSLYIRFTNPDLTETRLLLNHWIGWMFVAACNFGGFYLIFKK